MTFKAFLYFIVLSTVFISLSVEKALCQNYISKGLVEVGAEAPDFSLISTTGDSIHLSDYVGKIVILDFWYVGCRPCIKAYWDIDSLKLELGAENFVVIGMNPINRKNKINRFKKKYNYKDITAVCRKTSIKNDYRISAYPTIYIIDKQGKIAFASAGYYDELKNKMRDILKQNIPNRKFL